MNAYRGKLLMVGLCGALALLGPLAAETIGSNAQPSPPQPLEVAQAATLAAPRAVQRDGLAVGDTLDARRLHVITRPGLYGLNGNAPGDSLGIIDGMLVRYDPADMRLKSIIRADVTPVD